MEENKENTVILPYSLGRKERATHVWVDRGDQMILKMYKKSLKCTMTAALHHLIGLGARCHEEKHTEEIAFLQDKAQTQTRIIFAYIKKYGKLQSKDLHLQPG
ncbi:hypothetical protein ACFLWF_00065 [Chloroflexota bacterium]